LCWDQRQAPWEMAGGGARKERRTGRSWDICSSVARLGQSVTLMHSPCSAAKAPACPVPPGLQEVAWASAQRVAHLHLPNWGGGEARQRRRRQEPWNSTSSEQRPGIQEVCWSTALALGSFSFRKSTRRSGLASVESWQRPGSPSQRLGCYGSPALDHALGFPLLQGLLGPVSLNLSSQGLPSPPNGGQLKSIMEPVGSVGIEAGPQS
jgi:hypothetical protein